MAEPSVPCVFTHWKQSRPGHHACLPHSVSAGSPMQLPPRVQEPHVFQLSGLHVSPFDGFQFLGEILHPSSVFMNPLVGGILKSLRCCRVPVTLAAKPDSLPGLCRPHCRLVPACLPPRGCPGSAAEQCPPLQGLQGPGCWVAFPCLQRDFFKTSLKSGFLLVLSKSFGC